MVTTQVGLVPTHAPVHPGKADSFGESGWADWVEEAWGETKAHQIPGVGSVTVIEHEGGGEGDGEHTYLIFQVVDDNGVTKFYQKDGFYASFHGTDWDGGFYRVKKVTKTVEVYERVN